MFSLSGTPQDPFFIINISGRIDANSAKDMEQQCFAWIDSGNTQLIFDFSAVDYISSAGLRVFLLVAKRLTGVNGSVRMCSLSPTIRDVFDISGFSTLFSITPTVQDALAA